MVPEPPLARRPSLPSASPRGMDLPVRVSCVVRSPDFWARLGGASSGEALRRMGGALVACASLDEEVHAALARAASPTTT